MRASRSTARPTSRWIPPASGPRRASPDCARPCPPDIDKESGALMLQASASESQSAIPERPFVTYDAHPDRYVHWKLSVSDAGAPLTLDVAEGRGTRPGYKVTLTSYDLGVDIE